MTTHTVGNDPSVSASTDPYFSVTNPGDLPIALRIQLLFPDAASTGVKAIIGTRQNPGDATANSYNLGWSTLTADIDATMLAPSAPTLAVGAAGNVNTGTHYYIVSLVGGTAFGETGATAAASVAPGVDSIIQLTNIPLGPAGTNTTARKVYRTKVGGSIFGPYYLVTTIADNTTTTYNDNTADSGIGAAWTSVDWAAGGGGSTGAPAPHAVVVSHSTVTGWARRLYGPSGDVMPKGTFRAFARFRKGTATDTTEMRLQWSVGPASLTTSTVRNDVATFDGVDYNTTDTILADLGTVSIPTSNLYLYAELWERVSSGTGMTAFDGRVAIYLVPTENYSVVSIQPVVIDDWSGDQPTYQSGSLTISSLIASLTTANDEVRFFTGAGNSSGGQTLATGVHHLWIFDLEHSDASMTSTLKVYNNTTAATAASRTKTSAGREKLTLRTSAANNTDLYYAAVTLTTAGTGTVVVNGVRHYAIYYVNQNEAMQLDALVDPHLAVQLNTSLAQLRSATHRGNWPMLAPNNTDVVILLLDSDAYPAGETHLINRTATVTVTGMPAYAH